MNDSDSPKYSPNMDERQRQAFADFYTHRYELPGGMMIGAPQDYVGAIMALSGTLYFRWGWTDEKREAICRCFDRYKEIAGDHLKWIRSEESPNEKEVQPYKGSKDLRKLYSSWDPDTLVIRHYKGDDSYKNASPYSFFIGARRKWKTDKIEKNHKNGCDVLRFSLPIETLVMQPNLLQELLLYFCQQLKPFHGFGGLRLELSPEVLDNEPTEAWLAQQYNGIIVGSDYASSRDLDFKKIKTVSWLTVIGSDLLSEYSDTWLRSELPPSWYACYKYDTGLIIQAGNMPDIAHIPENALPAAYVLLNWALKPFRTEFCDIHHNTQRTPLITGSPSVELWLARFDVPEEQLIEYKHKLTQMPVLKKKHVLYDAVDPHFQHLYR